ncbi:hypothetical protein BJX70DRAFT_393216 [Aspergillus crustosus]
MVTDAASTTPTPTQDTTPSRARAAECSPPEQGIEVLPREREREPRGRIPIRRRSRSSRTPSPANSAICFLHHPKPRLRVESPYPPSSFPEVSSHTDLFTLDNAQNPNLDRIVLLNPFNREAYITTHAATHVDFTTWLPLLALGAPETWYTFNVSETPISTAPYQPLISPSHTVLKPLGEPRPVGLKVPRIAASAALQHSATRNTEQNLLYLSIQTTISGLATNRNGRWVSPDRFGLPDQAGNSTTGQNIYRVVKAGSREEAAAQAFYNAGGNRWSTVFTCVVAINYQTRGAMLDAERYVRVGGVEELGGGDGEGSEKKEDGGKVRVFY